MNDTTTSTTFAIGNNLRNLIADKTGAAEFKPTAKLLTKLNMTRRRFYDVYRNRRNPDFQETYNLLEWLRCGFFDLAMYEVPPPAETIINHHKKKIGKKLKLNTDENTND